MKGKLADTALAYWLDHQMAITKDPATNRTGLSQRALAMQSGVPQSVISNILIRGTVPGIKTLNQLAVFFEVHPLILVYIANYTDDSLEDFEKLTELGKLLFKMPGDVARRFLESEELKAQVAKNLS